MEVVVRRGLSLTVWLFFGLIIWAAAFYPNEPSPAILDALGGEDVVIVLILGLIRIGMTVRRLVRRRTARRDRVMVDEQIKQSVGRNDSHVEQLAAKVQLSQSGKIDPGLSLNGFSGT
ncbi:MAG: hypothetical protein ACRDZO_05605 [Egibacteraceae bacterium]